LFFFAGFPVDEDGLRDTGGIEAGVLEEMLVFGGKDSVGQVDGDVGIAQVPVTFAVLALEIREGARFQGIGLELAVVLEGNDAPNPLLLERKAGGIGGVRGSGMNFNAAAAQKIVGLGWRG
jgi:hypothetical protein